MTNSWWRVQAISERISTKSSTVLAQSHRPLPTSHLIRRIRRIHLLSRCIHLTGTHRGTRIPSLWHPLTSPLPLPTPDPLTPLSHSATAADVLSSFRLVPTYCIYPNPVLPATHPNTPLAKCKFCVANCTLASLVLASTHTLVHIYIYRFSTPLSRPTARPPSHQLVHKSKIIDRSIKVPKRTGNALAFGVPECVREQSIWTPSPPPVHFFFIVSRSRVN